MKLLRALAVTAVVMGSACVNVAYQAGKRASLPETAGVAHEESRAPGVKDVLLFRQSWRPPGGVPVRAALVLMHGLKDHSDRYQTIAEAAVRRGYSVYAFDLRGHGDSEGPRAWVDAFQDYVDDLAHFLTEVRAKEAGHPLFLLGHSMGGAVALETVLQTSQPPDGLILSAPALKPGAGVSGFEVFSTHVLGVVAPTLAVFKLDDNQFSHDPTVATSMHEDPLVYDGAGPAHTAHELLAAMDRMKTQMDALHTPVLILEGSEDRITNPDGSKELAARAKNKDTTLLVYPGMFHDLLHETNGRQVADDILGWMDVRAGGAGSAAALATP